MRVCVHLCVYLYMSVCVERVCLVCCVRALECVHTCVCGQEVVGVFSK